MMCVCDAIWRRLKSLRTVKWNWKVWGAYPCHQEISWYSRWGWVTLRRGNCSCMESEGWDETEIGVKLHHRDSSRPVRHLCQVLKKHERKHEQEIEQMVLSSYVAWSSSRLVPESGVSNEKITLPYSRPAAPQLHSSRAHDLHRLKLRVQERNL